MKALVATKELQGQRKADFCFVEEGEPIVFSSGHHTAMVGVVSRKATTTFKVVEMDLTPGGLATMVVDSYRRMGMVNPGNEDRMTKDALGMAEELFRLADNFQVGTVVEKQGRSFREREGRQGGGK